MYYRKFDIHILSTPNNYNWTTHNYQLNILPVVTDINYCSAFAESLTKNNDVIKNV